MKAIKVVYRMPDVFKGQAHLTDDSFQIPKSSYIKIIDDEQLEIARTECKDDLLTVRVPVGKPERPYYSRVWVVYELDELPENHHNYGMAISNKLGLDINVQNKRVDLKDYEATH